ncbi:coiled-coil domain-containing protein mad1, variant 2 [Orbilia brochopaga]
MSLEKLLRNTQIEVNNLKEQLHDLETQHSTLQRASRRELEELKSQNHSLEGQINTLQSEYATQGNLLQTCQSKLLEREKELLESQEQGDGVRNKPEDATTLKVLKRELGDQLNYVKTLEAKSRRLESENQDLRSYAKGMSILEEEKRSLETKVQALDGLREHVSNLELQRSILEEERTAWVAFLQDDPDGVQFSSPAHLARAYVQTKIEKNALLEKFGRPDPSILQKDTEIESLSSEKAALSRDVQNMKQVIQKSSKERQRLERQKDLALKEANFLREQLKTYSTEEAVMMAGNYDDQNSQRIEELEKLLVEHKSEIDALTKQLQDREAERAASLAQATTSDQKSIHQQDLEQLEQKIETLQNELDHSQQAHQLTLVEVKALQKQLAAAETISRMRVLQLKDNPTARHEATKAEALQVLREENKALLAQLEGQPGGVKLVPIGTLERCRLDVKEMEALVAEKDKRMLRLKEMWSKKALEFRQAVYSLLGYEVDFQPNGRVKVTSMFHRSDLYGGVDTGIVFDGEQGTMKLCGGPNSQFAREIRNQLKFYVEERKEIPCFLAALTMEGYEKTTRAQQ